MEKRERRDNDGGGQQRPKLLKNIKLNAVKLREQLIRGRITTRHNSFAYIRVVQHIHSYTYARTRTLYFRAESERQHNRKHHRQKENQTFLFSIIFE